MATVSTLGFSIISRYSGGGVAAARRDLAALRAQMATLNDDLKTHTNLLGGIPSRWKAIGGAAALIAPSLVPIGAAALQATGALTAMAAGVGSALGAYGAAMKGAISQTMEMAKAGKALSPVQKEFVSSVNGMKGAWSQFIKDTQNQTLSTATHAVAGITAGIKLLKPLVDAVHPSLLQVSKDFENWMKGDRAKEYRDILAGIAKDAMPLLVTAGKNVLNVLGDGFRAFAPLAKGAAEAIAKGAESLSKWSDGGGFQRFLAYVKENAPGVKEFFSSFKDAISSVFEILKGFGGSSLNILTDALKGIATLNFANVQAAANAFLMLRNPLLWLVLNCPPLRDAIIALLGALNPATIYAVAAAFTAMRIAIMLMNAGLVSTPVGWLIIALAALATAIVFIATKTTWFQTAWTYTWNAIKAAAEAVWLALQTAWSAFITAMQVAWTAVSGALVTAWNAVWAAMSTAVHAVWTGLTTAWNAVVMGLSTAWTTVSTALVTAWNTVWTGLQTAAQVVWTALTTAWSAFVNGLSIAWTTVSGALTAAWNAVWQALSTAAQAVWTALTTAWTAFVNALSTAWTTVSSALTAAWNAVWNALSTAAQAVWTAMTTAWTAFINGLQTIYQTVSSALTAAWQAFWSGLQTAAQAVWTALQTAWQACMTAIQTAYNTVSAALTTAWNTFWNALKTAAQTVWTAMQTAWQTFLTAVQTAYTTVSTALTTAWNTFWNALKTAAQTVWTAMQTAWTTFLNAIKTAYDTTSAALKTAWDAAWNAIKTAATTIWDALKTAWETFMKAVQDIFKTAGDALQKAWQAVWDTIKETATKVWDGIKKAVSDGINGMLTPINALINGFNSIAKAVGLSISIPEIHVNFANGGFVGGAPEFAVGGTVNFARGGGAIGGYAPGRDTVPAMLSRGEGVLTPEAMRGIGGAGVLNSLNRKFAGHRGAGRGAKPLHFAQGGALPGSGGIGASRAWHKGGTDGWSMARGGILGGLGETSAFGGGNRFAIGGLPSEIPAPDPNNPTKTSGTVGQTPGKNEGGDDGNGGILGGLPGIGDLAKTILGGTGLAGLVLGFIGKEAFDKALMPLIDGITSNFGPVGEIMAGAAKKIGHGLLDFLVKKDEEKKKEYESFAVASAQSVMAWADLATQAMILGGLDPSQIGKFLALMQAESGGNPNAINTTDINAKNGVPSQGLMQVIPPTFAAYHVAGTSNNILDPLANMAASAAYIKSRYGGSVPGSPYALGTPGATSGMHLVGENGPEMVNFDGGESVTPAKETSAILSDAATAGTANATTAMAAPAAAAIGAASAPAGGMGGGMGAAAGTPEDVLALVQQLLDAAAQLKAAMTSMWSQVVATTNSSWASVYGDTFTPMNASLTATVPAGLTAMGTAWTTGFGAIATTSATQWTAMNTGAFTPMNAMMSTEVPAAATLMSTGATTAATTMSTGVTGATTEMQTGVQSSWDAIGEGTETTWTGVETSITDSVNAATTPINGLLGGFNNVSSALGMGINVPLIAFAAGGMAGFSTGGMLARNGGAVPGFSPGRDTFPAMLSPGEGVLTPEAVRGLGGPGFVFAANRKYSGHRGGGGSSSESLGKYMGHDARCGHATGGMAGVMSNGVQHFASGTISAQDAEGLSAAGIDQGSVVQGSFNSSVAASGSTHSGDGVVDLSDLGSVQKLRDAGWAAWERTPAEGFEYHVHAVYMKATGVDPSAMGQEISFINGGSGLPAGSASTAETNKWGLNLGKWDFGPLVKTIIDGGITSLPQLLAPLVKKHLTEEQVASGFSGLKGILDATDMGTGQFADSLMQMGDTTHDGIVSSIASQVGSASFDEGGLLQPGYTLAFNGTGKPEPVGHNLVPKNSGSPITIEVHTHGSATAEDVVEGINSEVLPKLRQLLNRGTGTNH